MITTLLSLIVMPPARPLDFTIPKSPAEYRAFGIDSVRLSRIGPQMKKLAEEGRFAGGTILIARNGRVALFESSGFADLATKKPVLNSTLHQVMSMTKPVIAVAIMQCAEEGLLNLDDPLEKYFPAFKTVRVETSKSNTVDLVRKPTIRHLLTHTSGLSGNDPGGLDDDAKRKLTLAQYAEKLGQEPMQFQPGTEIRYSGVGFSTLGRIVEIVSKEPLERRIQRKIFDPLGMKNTFFFLPESRRGDLAKTYGRGDDGKLKEFEHDRYRIGAKFANGGGGLYSDAADMARFIWAVSSADPKLLSPASVDVMTSNQTGNLLMDGGDERGFGLGWAVVRNAGGQTTLRSIGSFGHTGAFCTEFWTDRKSGLVAVFMSQGLGVGDDVRKTFNTMANAAALD